METSDQLATLQIAKAESDRKNYGKKHMLLREMYRRSPKDFEIDQDDGGYVLGLRHIPTGFRFHIPRKVSPLQKAAKSFYGDAARIHGQKVLSGQTPAWDASKSLWQNVSGHLGAVQGRGSQMIREADEWNKLQNAMQPGRGLRQYQQYLAGTRQPIVHDFADQLIQELPTGLFKASARALRQNCG